MPRTVFEKAVRELGYHPYPVPTATLSGTYTNPDGISRAACAYCGYCQRYGCMIGAKAQPTNVLMPVLQKRKNFYAAHRMLGAARGSSRKAVGLPIWIRRGDGDSSNPPPS